MPTYKLKESIRRFEENIKQMPYVNDKEYRRKMDEDKQREVRREISTTIPPKYWNAKTDDIPIDNTKPFYLHGEVGSGKTYYAYAVVRLAILKGELLPKLVNFPDICMTYRIAPFDSKQEIIEDLKCCSRLIFDDLGAETTSSASEELLSSIINYRIEHEKFFAFTSNFGIGKLPYDSRIKSRIKGIVKDNQFKFSGRDRRL